MSTPEYIYTIIILSDSDVEDTFSSTHSPDYILALSDYSLASPGNTSPNFSDDLTKDLLSSLSISLFHDDPYMKIIQAYDTIPPPQVIIALPAIVPPPMLIPKISFLPRRFHHLKMLRHLLNHPYLHLHQ
ncbi:hypothetical protein Tco_0037679 [Tanacetum coccineum]